MSWIDSGVPPHCPLALVVPLPSMSEETRIIRDIELRIGFLCCVPCLNGREHRDRERRSSHRHHWPLFSPHLIRVQGLAACKNSSDPAPKITQPKPAQDSREADPDAVETVNDKLEADEHDRDAHDEDGSGPRCPRHGAEETDEGEDRDEKRDKQQTRRERKEEVRAVHVSRKPLSRR
jgi:hypothetical protein